MNRIRIPDEVKEKLIWVEYPLIENESSINNVLAIVELDTRFSQN